MANHKHNSVYSILANKFQYKMPKMHLFMFKNLSYVSIICFQLLNMQSLVEISWTQKCWLLWTVMIEMQFLGLVYEIHHGC